MNLLRWYVYVPLHKNRSFIFELKDITLKRKKKERVSSFDFRGQQEELPETAATRSERAFGSGFGSGWPRERLGSATGLAYGNPRKAERKRRETKRPNMRTIVAVSLSLRDFNRIVGGLGWVSLSSLLLVAERRVLLELH